ncbi:hypothetical protein FOL47_009726 [Perkinsus chesapeaki]|uniref:3'-5' exonuclease domain-containing protein n=1 Tax=Perkinsus chesapeaki TaxID=330153 RepID=A0A7J6N1U5_PERCH|nr:hypothetical protein FOL47_009726 [Perkinsus chesapeaki]
MSFFHQISITSPQAPGIPPSPQQVCSTFLIQKVVVWMLSHATEDLRVLIEHPGARIARFTDGLQLMCAGIAEDAWRKYLEAGKVQRKCIEIMGYGLCNPAEERLYQHLSGFFHHYTVNPTTGEIACCLSDKVASFVNSEFRVYLVDDFGSLMNLLYQLSKLERIASNGKPTAMAVDFEGLNLSRDGAMSLAQLCLSSNPKSVYVVDITRLGFHAFHATTHTGTSLKSVMEDTRIEKVFYDPRNDVDALYYQFNVAPQNVFDLQLAEVALRRARGLTVRYVIGLFKCLISQPELFTQPAMMDFAQRINDAGKALYEPSHGGSFKVFTQRPLHTSIIVYASHDVRYLLPLKELFTKQLKEAGDDLYERVCGGGAASIPHRARMPAQQQHQPEDFTLAEADAPATAAPCVDFTDEPKFHEYIPTEEPHIGIARAEVSATSGNSESTEATAAGDSSNRLGGTGGGYAASRGDEGQQQQFGAAGEPFQGFLSAAIAECLDVHLQSPQLEDIPQTVDDYTQLEDLLLGCYYSDPDSYLNTIDPVATAGLTDPEKALVEAEVRDLFAKFVFTCMRAVDQWVPIYGNRRQPEMIGLVNHREMCYHFLMSFFHQISITSPQAPGIPPSPQQVCSTFLIQKVVVWMLSHPIDEVRVIVEYPGARIARFTDGLQAICANSAEDAWNKYIEAGIVRGKRISVGMSLTPATEEERLYQHLSGFYHHYVIDPATGELACCLSDKEEAFTSADFRVYSVDDFGSLMNLLCQLSDMGKMAEEGEKVAMAVDFEGLNLSRDGAMSLAQLCLSSDPRSVYVVDITRLGFHAFHATTHTGTSLKSVMEDTRIEKVFYDPRHDVDALYYQFNVAPQNVFDLQLAEVALRRARGLTVRYVIGLFKCLVQSGVFVQPELRDFATRINDIGKSLFEPKHGGSYKVFTERPLHPGIIVYASHDARYLLPLYDSFTRQLRIAGDNWYNRVLAASARRAEWYQHSDYLVATSEAPDI